MNGQCSLLLLGVEGGLVGGGLLESRLGVHAGEKVPGRVGVSNSLDESLGMEISEEGTSDRSVNLELLAESGSGDTEDLGDVLGQLVVSVLVEEDFVVKLILDLNFGPGLLLGLGGALLGAGLLRSLGVFSRRLSGILAR